jgi:hypothetical protein
MTFPSPESTPSVNPLFQNGIISKLPPEGREIALILKVGIARRTALWGIRFSRVFYPM